MRNRVGTRMRKARKTARTRHKNLPRPFFRKKGKRWLLLFKKGVKFNFWIPLFDIQEGNFRLSFLLREGSFGFWFPPFTTGRMGGIFVWEETFAGLLLSA